MSVQYPTTTIGNLAPNPTPASSLFVVVDDGVSNTWRTTIAALLQSGGLAPVLLSPATQQTGTINVSGTIEGDGGFVTTNATAFTSSPGASASLFLSNSTATTGFNFNAATAATNIARFSAAGTAEVLISNTGGIAAVSSISAGSATQATLSAGDLGASRSISTGALFIGGSSASVRLDYGVTTGNVLTINAPFTITSLNANKMAGGLIPGNITIVGTAGYYSGTGAPTFPAANGSEYLRYDGGTGTRVYYNTSGASTIGTTWTAVTGI